MSHLAPAPVLEVDAVTLAEQFVDELMSDAGIKTAAPEVLASDVEIGNLAVAAPRRSTTAEPATLYRRS